MKFATAVGRHLWITVTGIFVFAFVWRAIRWFPTAWHTPGVEVMRTALCFAEHGFLGNPYVLPTGPSAHVTPAFPFLLGLAYKIAPTLQSGQMLASAVTLAITSLQYALLPLLSRVAGMGLLAGILAGFLGASVRTLLYLESSGDFEAPLAGLALVLAAIATFALDRWCRSAQSKYLLKGALWALAGLVSAQLLAAGVLYETVRLLIMRHMREKLYAKFGCLAVGFVIAVLPWTARNYFELGAPVISRDNLGMELYISNNDYAAPTFEENAGQHLFRRLHPSANVEQAALVQRLGEIRYNELKGAQALTWIRTHPKRFLELFVLRFGNFWIKIGRGKWLNVYWVAILVLGLAGFWFYRYTEPIDALLFLFTLIAFSVPHFFIEASYRYRYPLTPILLLFTAYLLERAGAHVLASRSENSAALARSSWHNEA